MPRFDYAVLGLGASGRSLVRYLSARGYKVAGVDDKAQARAKVDVPTFKVETLPDAEVVALSPGIDPKRFAEHRLSNDVAIFLEAFTHLNAKRPPDEAHKLIAITGSNGKSTVTQWVYEGLQGAGYAARVGGNIGTPVLDLLDDLPLTPIHFVLELSSFQLELVQAVNADVAVILNLSPDHLDRHTNMQGYLKAKLPILQGAAHAIYVDNADAFDVKIHAALPARVTQVGRAVNDEIYCDGRRIYLEGVPLIDTQALKIAGRHNHQNAGVVAGIWHALGLSLDEIRQGLLAFGGLPHRCQYVGHRFDMAMYNDSKGTNIGATITAVDSLQEAHHALGVILGGVGKGQDFGILADALAGVQAVFLIGQDALRIKYAFEARAPTVHVHLCQTLQNALECAKTAKCDALLLSPACASVDQFDDYAHRGRVFCELLEV